VAAGRKEMEKSPLAGEFEEKLARVIAGEKDLFF
jgi:hypothetical protein